MPTSSHLESLSVESFDVSEFLTLEKKVAFGGFCDLYVGYLKRGNENIKVAVKELRVISQVEQDRFRKHFLREVNAWKGLYNSNIVPFLGYAGNIESGPRLISPWYENGNLREYLAKYPDTNRFRLLVDVLQGMRYLESRDMVHGDLKSLNILVDSDGHACLCDFGATRLLGTVTGLTTTNQNSMSTHRFSSPERLRVEGPPTIKSDIWAFGCIVIEVVACQRPYEHLSDRLVHNAIVNKQLPFNPNYDLASAFGRIFWDFIKRCWEYDPKDRPTIDELLNYIRGLLLEDVKNLGEFKNTQEAGFWSNVFFRRARWVTSQL